MHTAAVRTSRQPELAPASLPSLSNTLEPLRDIVTSLRAAREGKMPAGRVRTRLLKRVEEAGAAALPALLRALHGDSAGEAAWAHLLLVRLGQGFGAGVRQRLDALVMDPRPSDTAKVRALAVLSDLGAPLSERVVLRNPQAVMNEAVRDLLSGLSEPGALGEAIDLIFESVPEDELVGVLTEIAESGGEQTQPLITAVIGDIRTPAAVAQALTGLCRPPARLRRRASDALIAERVHERLERALDLIQRGEPQAARRRLELLRSEHTEAAEVASALGLCLLKLGQAAAALEPLLRAAELEPHVAVHAWNVAAAAQAAGPDHHALCRAQLARYLGARDDHPGAAARRREAERRLRRLLPEAPKQRPHHC